MIYNWLFAGDLHKLMRDKTTIKGSAKLTLAVQRKLMEIIVQENITHFGGLGDWFDKGYGSDVAAALAHTDIDREMAKLLNGNFYSCIGNHIRINMDSNPELFLIQPHPYYTSRHKVDRKEQIIKTPKSLMCNGVQISFVHYNKDAEDAGFYKTERNPEAKYHIALYHTPLVIPTHHLHRMGMTHIMNENSKVAKALEGVDLAIVGDIHKPLGQFKIEKADGSSTTMIVPGSLTNTDAGMGSRHNSIEMPNVIIDEDGNVTLKFIHMDLMTNKVVFMKKELDQAQQTKLRSIRGNNVTTLYDDLESVNGWVGTNDLNFQSLNMFMASQSYTDCDKKMIKSVIHQPENIKELITMYKAETHYDVEV